MDANTGVWTILSTWASWAGHIIVRQHWQILKNQRILVVYHSFVNPCIGLSTRLKPTTQLCTGDSRLEWKKNLHTPICIPNVPTQGWTVETQPAHNLFVFETSKSNNSSHGTMFMSHETNSLRFAAICRRTHANDRRLMDWYGLIMIDVYIYIL